MPKPSKWGRTETIIWPPHSPIYTYGAIFLSIVAAGLFLYLRFSFVLTPLQQFYVPYYLRTQMAGVMHKTDKYQLLVVAGTSGGHGSGCCAGPHITSRGQIYPARIVVRCPRSGTCDLSLRSAPTRISIRHCTPG